MLVVGVVEIAAGLADAVKPRYAAYIVAAWLAGIVINLVSYPGFYDIALRDFGLMLAALSLARLASVYDPPVGARPGRRRRLSPAGGPPRPDRPRRPGSVQPASPARRQPPGPAVQGLAARACGGRW